jgi:hypothetical protein
MQKKNIQWCAIEIIKKIFEELGDEPHEVLADESSDTSHK